MLPKLCLSCILLILMTETIYCAKQPHILFILADDYGWNDVGKEMFLFFFDYLSYWKGSI